MSFRTKSTTSPQLPETTEIEFSGPAELAVAEHRSERGVARVRLLWRHRSFLLRVLIYAVVASTLVAFLIPTRYSSTARLMPPDDASGSGLSSASGLAAAAAAMSGSGRFAGMLGDLLGMKSTSDTFVGILGSRTAEDKLIEQFNLKALYHDRRMEDARADLASRTDVTVDRKSQIISITVTDKSPQRAAAMAGAYVQELNYLVAELSTSAARRERIFLESRLQNVNHDLEKAEKDFSQFASKNTTINITEQGRAMVDAAAMLQGQLIATQSELEGLRQIYSDNNARVRSLRARADELNRQLDKLGGKDESGSTSTAQAGDSMYPSIRKLPILGVEYADLYRQTRTQEAVYETLTQEYEMAKVQEAKEIPTVKVLDVPDIPDKKSFPPRLLIIALGTVFGLIFGAAWIFGYEVWNKTDADDPRKAFAREVFLTVTARAPLSAQSELSERSTAIRRKEK